MILSTIMKCLKANTVVYDGECRGHSLLDIIHFYWEILMRANYNLPVCYPKEMKHFFLILLFRMMSNLFVCIWLRMMGKLTLTFQVHTCRTFVILLLKPFQDLGLGFNNRMHNVEQGQNTDRKWNFHNGRTEWSQLWFYLNQPTFKRAASFLFFLLTYQVC